MLEPSNPRPSSKTPSSSLPTGIVKCCHVPKRSQNRRSTALTSFSRQKARTSRGVMGEGSGFGGRGSGMLRTKKKREAKLTSRSLFLTTHHSPLTTHLLNKQHFLIGRQRPEI